MTREYCAISTSIGLVGLQADNGALVQVDLRPADTAPREPGSQLLREAARQIREYLQGDRRAFDLPTRRPATASRFQQRVWDALLAIPRGETRTYGEIAGQLGSSARAVGGACRSNPLPLLVPCHRVVAKHGLGGFSGDWETGLAVDIKRVLLDLENRA